MNRCLLVAGVVAALVVPMKAHAQTFTDNAGNYPNGYADQGGGRAGFGAFKVVTAAKGGGAAGTFVFTAKEAEQDGGAAGDTPDTIDTPPSDPGKHGSSFGFYAKGPSGGAGDPSVTITRAFNVPAESSGLMSAGDTFALDFVTGYNDNGTSGVALTTTSGPVGTFVYQSGGTGFVFNGVKTGVGYNSGALHVLYTILSATAYSIKVTGAVTYSGTGSLSAPVRGFQVQQINTGGTNSNYNGYFNNLVVKSVAGAQ